MFEAHLTILLGPITLWLPTRSSRRSLRSMPRTSMCSSRSESRHYISEGRSSRSRLASPPPSLACLSLVFLLLNGSLRPHGRCRPSRNKRKIRALCDLHLDTECLYFSFPDLASSLYGCRERAFLFGIFSTHHMTTSMAALASLVALRLLLTFSSLPELLQDSHQLTTPLTSYTRCEQTSHGANWG